MAHFHPIPTGWGFLLLIAVDDKLGLLSVAVHWVVNGCNKSVIAAR
jgi:hypothetical protein